MIQDTKVIQDVSWFKTYKPRKFENFQFRSKTNPDHTDNIYINDVNDDTVKYFRSDTQKHGSCNINIFIEKLVYEFNKSIETKLSLDNPPFYIKYKSAIGWSAVALTTVVIYKIIKNKRESQ